MHCESPTTSGCSHGDEISPDLRKFVRACIWLALACCLMVAAGLGEAAISGCCDVGYWKNGRVVFPGPEPELWLPICLFVIVQGVLVFALIRLRHPEQN